MWALGAGVHGPHGERRIGSRPGQRQRDRRCLGLPRVLEPPNVGRHHDNVVGGVLSPSVHDSQPDEGGVAPFCCPDNDLIVSAVVEAKLELGPSTGLHEQVPEERVGDRSHRADGDKDRRLGVDG
jgi:hypothetical protein